MALAESVETQIKGMVSIPYICFGAEGKAGQLYLWRMAKLRICLPLRIAAVHVCKEDETGTDLTALLFGFFSFFYNALPKEVRTRIRLHRGAFLEGCRISWPLPGSHIVLLLLISGDRLAHGMSVRSVFLWYSKRFISCDRKR